MAGWRGPATLLAFLLLCPLPSPSCPAICRCSSGEVDCRYRALRFVPENLPTNARAMWLGYNHFAVLKAHSFRSQRALQNLSLRNNVLVSIHSQALAGLGALRELDLSNNYLTVLTAETFLPLPGLVVLNVGANKLGQLPPEVLKALPRLQELFLHSNALRSLHASVFLNLTAVRSLTLQGNPWACTCKIQPLFLWIMGNRDKIQGKNGWVMQQHGEQNSEHRTEQEFFSETFSSSENPAPLSPPLFTDSDRRFSEPGPSPTTPVSRGRALSTGPYNWSLSISPV